MPRSRKRLRPAATVAAPAVAITLLLAAACGGGQDTDRAASDRGARSSTTPTAQRTLSPAALCTKAVVYWTGEMLDAGSDTGFDYQSMGLSDSQYTVVRDLYAKAREHGSADRELVRREAARRCRDSARAQESGVPPQGGWPG